MADFARALPFILSHEGGWSDDQDDPGGATNYGITLETARRHGIEDKEDLLKISQAKVAEIYRKDYWRFNRVYSQEVAAKIFDMAVNFGLRTAVKLVQGVMNGMGCTLSEDGIWGTHTEDCVNAVEPHRMLKLLCDASADRYRSIVAHRPASAKYLNGWLLRASSLPGVMV